MSKKEKYNSMKLDYFSGEEDISMAKSKVVLYRRTYLICLQARKGKFLKPTTHFQDFIGVERKEHGILGSLFSA